MGLLGLSSYNALVWYTNTTPIHINNTLNYAILVISEDCVLVLMSKQARFVCRLTNLIGYLQQLIMGSQVSEISRPLSPFTVNTTTHSTGQYSPSSTCTHTYTTWETIFSEYAFLKCQYNSSCRFSSTYHLSWYILPLKILYVVAGRITNYFRHGISKLRMWF